MGKVRDVIFLYFPLLPTVYLVSHTSVLHSNRRRLFFDPVVLASEWLPCTLDSFKTWFHSLFEMLIFAWKTDPPLLCIINYCHPLCPSCPPAESVSRSVGPVEILTLVGMGTRVQLGQNIKIQVQFQNRHHQ